MTQHYTYACTYTQSFPVDEYGRPGGMYSLADLPVKGHKDFTREGIVTAQNSSAKLYEVKDKEKGWTFVVPFDKVIVGEQLDPVTV